MQSRLAFILAALAAAAAPVGAQQPKHDHAPKHGGVVVEVATVDYELVAKPEALAIYVSDHGKPVDTKGATAMVTLTSGGDKATVKLEPAGANKLEAKGSFKVGPGTTAVATVTLEGRKPARVRFAIK